MLVTTPTEKKGVQRAVESVRAKMRTAADQSGLTQEQIGVKMGFAQDSARKAVSRLLNAGGYDPRLSTVVAFANAVGKPVSDFM